MKKLVATVVFLTVVSIGVLLWPSSGSHIIGIYQTKLTSICCLGVSNNGKSVCAITKDAGVYWAKTDLSDSFVRYQTGSGLVAKAAVNLENKSLVIIDSANTMQYCRIGFAANDISGSWCKTESQILMHSIAGSIAVHPGENVTIGSEGGEILTWSNTSGAWLFNQAITSEPINSLALINHSDTIAARDKEGKIILVSTGQKKILSSTDYSTLRDATNRICASLDGTTLAINQWQRIKLIESSTLRCLSDSQIPGRLPLSDFGFAGNNSLVVAMSLDGRLYLIDVKNSHSSLIPRLGKLKLMSTSQNGQYAAVCNSIGDITVINLNTATINSGLGASH